MFNFTRKEIIALATTMVAVAMCQNNDCSLTTTTLLSVACAVVTNLITTGLEAYNPRLFGDAKKALYHEGVPGANNGFVIKDVTEAAARHFM